MQCLHSAEATISAVGTALHDKTAQPKDLLPQLQKELQSVGVALTSFAHPSACNNPLCSNSTKPSEAALVQSKTSRCSACRAARYCGKACQVSHWKQHKHVCKRLAAAAGGSSSGCCRRLRGWWCWCVACNSVTSRCSVAAVRRCYGNMNSFEPTTPAPLVATTQQAVSWIGRHNQLESDLFRHGVDGTEMSQGPVTPGC